jgi:hypothetical protein
MWAIRTNHEEFLSMAGPNVPEMTEENAILAERHAFKPERFNRRSAGNDECKTRERPAGVNEGRAGVIKEGRLVVYT